MSVGLIVITHGETGRALVDVGEFILGESLERIRVVSFRQSGRDATVDEDIREAAEAVDCGQGILLLTDLVGASPFNLVNKTLRNYHALTVTGLNLAMLIRVWNYRQEPLKELAGIALDGGKRAVEVKKP